MILMKEGNTSKDAQRKTVVYQKQEITKEKYFRDGLMNQIKKLKERKFYGKYT